MKIDITRKIRFKVPGLFLCLLQKMKKSCTYRVFQVQCCRNALRVALFGSKMSFDATFSIVLRGDAKLLNDTQQCSMFKSEQRDTNALAIMRSMKGEIFMCKYAVVDLEMCKVPHGVRKDKFRWARETIQIGAVLLNESLEIIDEFVTYVAPQYGFIDTFINNLTGISRGDVAKAPEMKEALQAFVEWLPEDTKVVSWSNNDEVQIRHEIEAKEIFIDGLEGLLENWIDCQKIFAEKMNNQRCYKLLEALVAADIIYEDGAHDGLVDAYNTALLFAKMERESELVLNPYYKRAITSDEEDCGFSLGSLFAGIDLSGFAMA